MIKLFRKKSICRVIVILLLTSLSSSLLPLVPVYAIQPTLGGGNKGGSIGGGYLQSLGVMVTIREIKNKQVNKGKNDEVDEMNKQVHDNWYNSFPNEIHQPGASSKYALVIRSNGGYMVSERPANYFVYGDDQN